MYIKVLGMSVFILKQTYPTIIPRHLEGEAREHCRQCWDYCGRYGALGEVQVGQGHSAAQEARQQGSVLKIDPIQGQSGDGREAGSNEVASCHA
jgi:hypothetical protein